MNKTQAVKIAEFLRKQGFQGVMECEAVSSWLVLYQISAGWSKAVTCVLDFTNLCYGLGIDGTKAFTK